MEYSGPDHLSALEEYLAMNVEEDRGSDHWPVLPGSPVSAPHDQQLSSPSAPNCASNAASSSKRPMDDSSGDSPPPVSKASRLRESPVLQRDPPRDVPRIPLPRHIPQLTLPAFAPRAEYVRLMFEGDPSVETKLRWLAEVNRAYHLERSLAEVKMSAVTSKFVYVSRQRLDVLKSAEAGEFLSLKLIRQDSPARPRKLPAYLITRYPVGVDPSLSKEMDGVYSARRFHQDGQPLNRIVVTWTLEEPPPSSFSFSFLPCLPACEVRHLDNDRPSCYKCWGVGHISRYCSAQEKCAWCSGGHDSRSCPHRAPPPPPPATDETTEPPRPPPADVTAHWRCPRCQTPGVNVWHGCSRRRVTPSSPPVQPPPPPPPPSQPLRHSSAVPSLTSTAVSPSPHVRALRSAVEKLMTRCASLESRLDTIEARISSIETSQAKIEATLETLVESERSAIAAVTSLTEKMDALASRFEDTSVRLSPTPSRPSRLPTSSAPGSRSSRKPTVR